MLWDALCVHALWDDEPEINAITFSPHLSKLTSLDARQQVEQQLWSAVKKSHYEDIKYVPHVNEHYPRGIRQFAASFFCTAGLPSREEHPTQDLVIDIPPGILDNTPLAVMLGGIAWFAAYTQLSCLDDSNDNHDHTWHRSFCWIVEDYMEIFTECPLPMLPAQGFAFCMEVYFDCYDEGFPCGEPKRVLKIFAAVAIHLTSKNVLLQCCPRCQFLYTQFFSDAALSGSINESSANTHASGNLSHYIPRILLILDCFVSQTPL